MKVAVRYYTKTGNTEKLAKAVADAVGAEALPISEPIDEPVSATLTMRSASIPRCGIMSARWTAVR